MYSNKINSFKLKNKIKKSRWYYITYIIWHFSQEQQQVGMIFDEFQHVKLKWQLHKLNDLNNSNLNQNKSSKLIHQAKWWKKLFPFQTCQQLWGWEKIKMIALTASKQHVPWSHYKGPGALGIRVTYPWQEIAALSPFLNTCYASICQQRQRDWGDSTLDKIYMLSHSSGRSIQS